MKEEGDLLKGRAQKTEAMNTEVMEKVAFQTKRKNTEDTTETVIQKGMNGQTVEADPTAEEDLTVEMIDQTEERIDQTEEMMKS